MLEIWIFFLQKRMDWLQEAFIHPGAVPGTVYYGWMRFIELLLH